MTDFHFCGKNKVPGLPYCEFHARRAFQPPQARRRDRSDITEPKMPAISAPQTAPGKEPAGV
jgi:GcrA cell cycle regulator